jgi:hypothetical protein
VRRRIAAEGIFFAERFDKAMLLVRRQTWRLDTIVHHLGLALGGRRAASFAKRLMLPVSTSNTASPASSIVSMSDAHRFLVCAGRQCLGATSFRLALKPAQRVAC